MYCKQNWIGYVFRRTRISDILNYAWVGAYMLYNGKWTMFNYIMEWTSYIWWDDVYVHFVLDQHALSWIFIVLSLSRKQQSSHRHVVPLWHIILIPLKQQSSCRHVVPLWHIILIPLKQQFSYRHVVPLWHIILIPLKQQSSYRYVVPLWHIILIPSEQVLMLRAD